MRDYEDDGYTENTFICPVCGMELGEAERLYLNANNEVVGCERCIASQEVGEYLLDADERARDNYEDYFVQKKLGK